MTGLTACQQARFHSAFVLLALILIGVGLTLPGVLIGLRILLVGMASACGVVELVLAWQAFREAHRS